MKATVQSYTLIHYGSSAFTAGSFLSRYFSSLLTENNKDYIQRFASESFAFLMRKVSSKYHFLKNKKVVSMICVCMCVYACFCVDANNLLRC